MMADSAAGGGPALEVQGRRGAALFDRAEDRDERQGDGIRSGSRTGSQTTRHELDGQQRGRRGRGGDHAAVRARPDAERDAARHAVRVRLATIPRPACQPGFEAETQQLKAMVGAEFTFQDASPPARSRTSSCPRRPSRGCATRHRAGVAGREISEKSIKEMLLQSSPPSFPDGEIEPGKTWSSKPSRMPLGFATMVVEQDVHLPGPRSQGAEPAPRRHRDQGDARARRGGERQGHHPEAGGPGSMTFDAEAGHLVSARMTQKIDMAITGDGPDDGADRPRRPRR